MHRLVVLMTISSVLIMFPWHSWSAENTLRSSLALEQHWSFLASEEALQDTAKKPSLMTALMAGLRDTSANKREVGERVVIGALGALLAVGGKKIVDEAKGIDPWDVKCTRFPCGINRTCTSCILVKNEKKEQEAFMKIMFGGALMGAGILLIYHAIAPPW